MKKNNYENSINKINPNYLEIPDNLMIPTKGSVETEYDKNLMIPIKSSVGTEYDKNYFDIPVETDYDKNLMIPTNQNLMTKQSRNSSKQKSKRNQNSYVGNRFLNENDILQKLKKKLITPQDTQRLSKQQARKKLKKELLQNLNEENFLKLYERNYTFTGKEIDKYLKPFLNSLSTRLFTNLPSNYTIDQTLGTISDL